MRLAGKKGEKSLQMIFGLFILLIISLVVLSLFFKFTEKSSSTMSSTGKEYFAKAAVDKAIQECQVLCESIEDVNTAIEFCKKYQSIDWDGDNLLNSKVSYGRWDFCEDKVPCFVLVDNCKEGIYNGEGCNSLLDQYRDDFYESLYNEPNGNIEEGTCGLDPNSPGNWKMVFGFNNPPNPSP